MANVNREPAPFAVSIGFDVGNDDVAGRIVASDRRVRRGWMHTLGPEPKSVTPAGM
jgi:hypothetical protein